MLPAQLVSGGRVAEPQKRLMAAVLQAVVDDCQGGSLYRRSSGKGTVGPRSIRKAVAYVTSTDRAWPFSFENLCDALGLDTAALRRELTVMRLPAHIVARAQSSGSSDVQLIVSPN